MTDAEMDWLEPGDVILSPSGRARTVVDVRRCKGRLYVTVPILHCSWTKRPYTVLDRQILAGYRRTRMRRSLKTRLARLVRKDCQGKGERHCDCCDVVGRFE